jgi:hypothetical protein
LVILLPARGDRAASWPGTVQLPAESDCSGERHQRTPKRAARYAVQKRQNDAYQAVLSPFTSSGRLGIYQPLMTSCRKPLRQEALPVRARQAARPDRITSFRGLEFPQEFEGLREFFRGH